MDRVKQDAKALGIKNWETNEMEEAVGTGPGLQRASTPLIMMMDKQLKKNFTLNKAYA